MKTLGNIIWFLFGGIEWCIALLFAGLTLCITIIGIPIGVQLFKMATFVIWPFGKEVENISPKNIFYYVINAIWAIFLGWIFALCFLLMGLLYCITLIGIPFGLQYFKIASFVLLPLGHDFR